MSSQSLQLTDDVRAYLCDHGVREHPALMALRERTQALEMARMQICPEQGALMAMLVRLMGARHVIEVGTFTGYSALAMALALPSDGSVICCDVSEEWTALGHQAWADAGVAHKIDLRIAPALDTLAALRQSGRDGCFDLCFIDADKSNYLAYYEHCLALLRPGGAVLVDNVLWAGSVADDTNSEPSTEAIRALNRALAEDERIDISMLPIGDGLTIARKRG